MKNELKKNSIELPMDDAFYDRLHDRIMAAVEKTEMKRPSPWDKPKKLLCSQWKTWILSGGSLTMTLLAALQSPNLARSIFDESHTVQVVRNEDDFVTETLRSPEHFTETLISLQNQGDFFVDVAERSFHDLSKEHVREIMGKSGL